MTSHVQTFSDGGMIITTPAIEPSLEHFLSILSLKTLKSIMSDLQTIDGEWFNENINGYKNKVVEVRARLIKQLDTGDTGDFCILNYFDEFADAQMADGNVDAAAQYIAVTDCTYGQAQDEYLLRDMKPLIGEVTIVQCEAG